MISRSSSRERRHGQDVQKRSQEILQNPATYFVIGVFLATLFEEMISRSWVDLVLGVTAAFELMAAVMISVPVYTCNGAAF